MPNNQFMYHDCSNQAAPPTLLAFDVYHAVERNDIPCTMESQSAAEPERSAPQHRGLLGSAPPPLSGRQRFRPAYPARRARISRALPIGPNGTRRELCRSALRACLKSPGRKSSPKKPLSSSTPAVQPDRREGVKLPQRRHRASAQRERIAARWSSTRRPPFDHAEGRLTTYKWYVVRHYRLS